MFKFVKKIVAVVLSCALVLGMTATLSGCATESGDNGESSGGGTIVFGLSKTWESLRTTDAINVATHQVLSQIFDKIVYLDEENNVHPRGASSWEWSDDGTSLTLHLNEDATWHDGEKVTAEDYVFSYNFYATSEVQFTNRAGTKYLEGVDADTGIELSADSAAVEAVDEYTVKLTMNSVYNQTSYMVSALNSFYLLPKHCFTNEDGSLMSDEEIFNSSFWNAPIGSGPCIYESEVADSSITLKADKSYHLGAPQFDTMVMQVIDTSTAVDKILSGDVDILGFNLTTEVAEQYLEDENVIISAESVPTTQINLCFNNKRVPLKIRQAIDRGLDKEDILNKLYNGNGVVNYSLIFPNYPGYVERDIYNKDEAAQLVQEAIDDGDWSADSVLVIGVVSVSGENIATLIKSQLADLGIQVEIKQDEMATIQQAMITDLGTEDDYQYSCALWSLGGTYIPTKLMGVYALYADYMFFHNDPTGVYPIYSAYLTSASQEEEKEIIASFQEWEYENVPQSTIVQYGSYSATSPRMGNVDLFNTTNFNQASWLWTVS